MEFVVNFLLVLWHGKWVIGCIALAILAVAVFADDGRTFDDRP